MTPREGLEAMCAVYKENFELAWLRTQYERSFFGALWAWVLDRA